MDTEQESIIRAVREKWDGPFYLYDQKVIAERATRLLTDFPQFEFLYSIKANPFPPIAKYLARRGFGADAASAAEVDLALAAGMRPDMIFYSSPGKTETDLRQALGKSRVIVDSCNELALLNGLAAAKPTLLAVGLRLNPDFSLDGGPGVSAKFGVDEEVLFQRAEFLAGLTSLEITGLHVHLRSQVLEAEALAGYYERVFRLAVKCVQKFGWRLKFINFGGGLGIVYSEANDRPLDTVRLGRECAALARKYRPELGGIRLIIESGRYLVGQAGKYYTPIVDIKESRGRKYLIVRNGLNGFMRPAIADLLRRLPGSPADRRFSAEPLFTAPDAFDFSLAGKEDGAPLEKVSVVGNLCTAADVLAEDIFLPAARRATWCASPRPAVTPAAFRRRAFPATGPRARFTSTTTKI